MNETSGEWLVARVSRQSSVYRRPDPGRLLSTTNRPPTARLSSSHSARALSLRDRGSSSPMFLPKNLCRPLYGRGAQAERRSALPQGVWRETDNEGWPLSRKFMLRAGIVSEKSENLGPLLARLQQTGLVSSVQQWAPSPDLHLSPGGATPDVVLLDLSHDVEGCFALAAQMRRLRPDVHIIACSRVQKPSPEMLLQAMRCGIEDFFPLSVEPNTLKETLARFIPESGF